MSQLARRKALDIIDERFDLTGRRVIDIGCGDGGLVRALAQRGAHVTGVECGAEMLARACAAPPAADERYVNGAGQDLPVPGASADMVVFMNSLHHVPAAHMADALAEAARVLVPGGLALVNEPLAEGNFYQLTRLVEDEEAVRAAAQDAIRHAVAAGLFAEQAEIIYLNPVRMDSYDAFAQRMGLIDAGRKSRVAADAAQLRERFHALATARDGAYFFDQPARLNILVKPTGD